MMNPLEPLNLPDERLDHQKIGNAMLAEKYILLLETLRSFAERGHAYADGAPRVVSSSPHVPVKLPSSGGK
jgi:hypothetical protein